MISVPNALTLLRLALLAPVLVLVHNGHGMAALAVYFLLLATDMLDGWAARKFKQETRSGEYLDFVVDFACNYALIGYFALMGKIAGINIALVLIATAALAWVAAALSRKAKRLYMPHRISGKTLAVAVSVSIMGFLTGNRHANLVLAVALGVIFIYTLPDYLVYTLRYKEKSG